DPRGLAGVAALEGLERRVRLPPVEREEAPGVGRVLGERRLDEAGGLAEERDPRAVGSAGVSELGFAAWRRPKLPDDQEHCRGRILPRGPPADAALECDEED